MRRSTFLRIPPPSSTNKWNTYSSDSNLHFEPNLHGFHAFKVLATDGDILVIRLLAQIELKASAKEVR